MLNNRKVSPKKDMKRFIPLIVFLMAAPTVAHAGGLVHKMSSSVQLTVDSARSTATRIGHQMSISGNNVTTTDGTTSGVVGNAIGMSSDGFTAASTTITASQATSGESFSFSASYLQGDAVPAAAATVGDIPNFGSVTSYTAGTAGTLAGTIATDGGITLTAGGAGSTAVGQFVSEITVID